MVKNREWGIIVFLTVISLFMMACNDEETGSSVDPYELNVQVLDNTFSNTDQLTGTVRVAFMNSEGLSVNNLTWLTQASFSLSLYPTGGRTVSISDISTSQYNAGRVDVTLDLTRSALPDFDGGMIPKDSVTATVSVTGAGGYTIKMGENKYFTF